MKPENSQTKQPGQRKKKAARACIHCQKAHLTCDDSRPCQRCIKRNLANSCTDGARKKAKYLQDCEDSNSVNSTYSSTQSINTSVANQQITGFVQDNSPLGSTNFMNTNSPTDPLLNIQLPGSEFGSNITNLEYSILSDMLGSSLIESNTNQQQSTSSNSINMWPARQNSNITLVHGDQPAANIHLMNSSNLGYINGSQSPLSNNSNDVSNSDGNSNIKEGVNSIFPNQAPVTSISSSTIGTSQVSSSGISTLSAYGDGAVVAKVASPVTTTSGPTVRRRNQIITPEMAYASATKPFSYADGYHYLINYVKTRMNKEDLMRISRALALFRPSVLASMINLTEDDLVFTEKCLQRTLLEYEKLVSFSGTPSIIWRRTGEICLVGKEFSLLTQWSKDMLLNRKVYIYELMDNQSAVEYWEKYALHAFDNTDSAVHSTCILMSPTKRAVPCTFCFTIKRDIFDLPSVIVGNFLPILS
ncbi:hypothetical protein K501DRAFT_319343 [Backusella circina FSU 941]|nr:hypothetical protein K501DRAFT_319343 [Backusella circina FSU 941]